ncbi:BAHD acyltransferase DCR-like isoform X2 [Telopea speciosissima]|uniref:BAHD acyltransferase DCR-like isoform X2 n=1 Tax=Telopea speciosissima TaxID=54955 RepID=UPI001CC391BA|nr:BAHD acyltransferase DCR-like isoform X2 [Telopea speciosissima]
MAIENGKKVEVAEKDKMVKVMKKDMVRPSKDLGRRECPLVTFDLPYVTFYYNQKLLLYKGQNSNFDYWEEMVGKMKEALGEILVDFYPLAGRLEMDEEGVLRVVCDADNVGVEVVEAVADDVGIAELGEDESSLLLQEIVPYTGVLNLEGFRRPLLAVQLTKVRDGLAIGCAFNHAILDGHSTWHFMNSWAEICRGSSSISILPFHDRSKARNTRVKLDLPSDPSQLATSPLMREKIFRLSGSVIDKIKSDLNSSLSNGSKSFSTFQSLGVHIWRAVTRARHLNVEDYTVFTVFADCRKRLEPPMPESYFGNLIQAIFTVTATGALLENSPAFGASMVQKMIEMHDSKTIEGRNKEWEASPKLFQWKDAGINCVAVGSSPRFQVYDIDFGWGKPETVRSGRNNKFDGMVYLYQGKGGGRSIDVEISLEAQAMENLEKDKEFLME